MFSVWGVVVGDFTSWTETFKVDPVGLITPNPSYGLFSSSHSFCTTICSCSAASDAIPAVFNHTVLPVSNEGNYAYFIGAHQVLIWWPAHISEIYNSGVHRVCTCLLKWVYMPADTRGQVQRHINKLFHLGSCFSSHAICSWHRCLHRLSPSAA